MSIANINSQVAGRPQALPAEQVNQMKPKQKIAYLLEQRKGDIAKMLPGTLNPERLLKVATLAVTTTPALLECDVSTLIGAIGQCAQMGLEPNTILGHAYLVPFNGSRKLPNGQKEWYKSVQVIIGYKGLIDLARRSGQITSIAAHEVCKNDHFELAYGLEERLEHKPSMEERGEIIGFYAVAKLVGGGYAFEFMSLNEVNKIKLGTQSKGAYGPWKDNFAEMGRKTAIRRLAKYLPLSIEFQTAAALDGMADRGQDQNLNTFEGEFSSVQDDSAPVVKSIPFNQFAAQLEHVKAPEEVQALANEIRQFEASQDQEQLLAMAETRLQQLSNQAKQQPDPVKQDSKPRRTTTVSKAASSAVEVKQEATPVEQVQATVEDNPDRVKTILDGIGNASSAATVSMMLRYTKGLSDKDLSTVKDAMTQRNRELAATAKPSLKVRMESCNDSDELGVLSTEIEFLDPAIQPAMWKVYEQRNAELNA